MALPSGHFEERVAIRVHLPLIVLAGFVVAGGLGLLAGRGTAVGDPNVIRIVSSLPRSGSARGQTDSIVNGIRLAFDEVGYTIATTDPETKESRTYRLEFLDLDDATAAAGQWTIEQEIANANQARSDPDVMVYLGTYNSGAVRVAMPILNRANLLIVSPANTAVSLTKPGTGERHEPMCYRPTGAVNFVRVVPTDDLQSRLAARWIKDLGAQRVFVLDDNEMYGKGLSAELVKTLGELRVEVVGLESIDAKAQEFKPLLQKVKNLDPDLVYFAGTTQSKGGQVLKDMIAVGLTCPLMGPDGCHDGAMIDSAGPESFEKLRFYVTFGGLTNEGLLARGGRGAEFVRRYQAKHGRPPEAYGVYGYEAGLVAIEAIRIAGRKDRDAIRRAALGITDFVGATGTWSFDKNGDTTNQTMSGSTVKNGSFQFVRALKLNPD